ncbi:MAG TPA: endolytic transglycosylase MltG [bacterium]|jgi:UPF0755 protein
MPFKVKHSVFLISLGGIIVLAALLAKAYIAIYTRNPPRPAGEFAEISITEGMNVHEIATLLLDKKVIRNAREFIFSARLLRLDDRIQAGVYPLPYGQTNALLLLRLTTAGASAALITIPEGMISYEIAQLLEQKIGLDSAVFMKAVYDTALCAKNDIHAPSLEGYLFPDSYHFYREMRADWIAQRMVNRFHQVFDSSFQARSAALGLSTNEVVTLASIIEGEMQDPGEDAIISAIYHNRLNKRMLLQADPTIQYIICNNRRRLYRSDLAVPSPYNTYLHAGLPPGPVCNPGKRALRAALNPASVPYLFMVSQGDGTHAFSIDLSDHLMAKARLDSLREALALSRKAVKDSAGQD